jgi:hypothetical protein
MSRRYTSTSGRRGGTVAGSLGLLLAATLLPAAPASAVEGDALPVGDWGTCADAADQYCVEGVTVVPLGDGAASTLTASAVTVPDEYVSSFDWSVDGWATQSEAVRDGALTLVIRTGQFVPRFTSAAADGMRVATAVDDGGNHTMTVTGHAVHVDWTTGEHAAGCVALQYCGEYDQTADAAGTGLRFEGNTQDTGEDNVSMDGAYIATGAQARTRGLAYSTDPEPSLWLGSLGNPQLDLNGEPVRGSYNAWVPAGYFEAVGTTAEAALATGFDLISDGDGMSASVPMTASARDGGVAFEVTDIAYPTAINQHQVFHRPSAAADGDTAPGAPQQVSGVGTDNGVIANWAAPASDGGSPIVGYRARAFSAATGGTVVDRCDGEADGTTCEMTQPEVGTTVYVTVNAFSALGEGPATDRVAVLVGDPVTAPWAPRAAKSVPGPGRLTVSWAAPLYDGGAAVTGYTVRAYRAATGGTQVGSCVTTAVKPNCVITGLTGVTHYVAVTAANSVGSSVPTARVAATPWTVATAPRSVTAKSAKSKITVGWAAPLQAGGTAVTKYEARLYTVAKGGTPALKCTATGAGRSCVSTTLKPGRVYYASVVALNAAGRSIEPTRVKVLVKR